MSRIRFPAIQTLRWKVLISGQDMHQRVLLGLIPVEEGRGWKQDWAEGSWAAMQSQ